MKKTSTSTALHALLLTTLMGIPYLASAEGLVQEACDLPLGIPRNKANCDSYHAISKDDQFVYWQGTKILGADPATFEQIDHYYAKDKDRVYHHFFNSQGGVYFSTAAFYVQKEESRQWISRNTQDSFWEVLYLADPKTFQVHPKFPEYAFDQNYLYGRGILMGKTNGSTLQKLDKNYSKTEDAVFKGFDYMHERDAPSFEVFTEDRDMTKDENHVYYGRHIEPSVKDPRSFVLLSPYFGRDKYTMYSIALSGFPRLKIAPEIDKDSFDTIDIKENLFKDKNYVYYRYNKIEGADPKTFQIYQEQSDRRYYAKDRAKIFWLNWDAITVDAEATTFEVSEINPKWGTDQFSVFYEGQKITDLNPKTFKVIGQQYIKDGNKVYFAPSSTIKLIENADAESFSVINDTPLEKVGLFDQGSQFSKDRFHVYYKNNIIDKADPHTFKLDPSNKNFVMDKNHAYLKRKGRYEIIKGVDIETFVINGYGAEDQYNNYSSTGYIYAKNRDNNASKKTIDSNKKKDFPTKENPQIFKTLQYEQRYPYKLVKNDLHSSSEAFLFGDYRERETYQIKTDYTKNHSEARYQNHPLKEANAESFIVIGREYGKDNQHVYYQDQLMNADSMSFTVLDSGYSRDKSQLFYQDKKIADLALPNYSEEPYRHYDQEYLLRWSYSDELDVYQQLPYARVGSKIFYLGKAIENVNSSTFYPLRYARGISEYYSRDENSVYYKTEKVEGADPNSFMIYLEPSTKYNYKDNIAKGRDKFSCYEETRKIDCPW